MHSRCRRHAPVLQGYSLPGQGRRYQALASDPGKVMDLAPGLEYRIISTCGDRMSDGLRVPGAHDGMAAFARGDGRVAIVCNHELDFGYRSESALRDRYPAFAKGHLAKFYDDGRGVSPGLGGTTTTIYNPASRTVDRQFLSLGGTELNCAGGPTPWGSWLARMNSSRQCRSMPWDASRTRPVPCTRQRASCT